MRPLAVVRWPKTTKNRPKNIPYSAQISHLVFTILADIAAHVTNLYSKHPERHSTRLARYLDNDGDAIDKETSGSHSTRSIIIIIIIIIGLFSR